jgi:hypothetical protein
VLSLLTFKNLATYAQSSSKRKKKVPINSSMATLPLKVSQLNVSLPPPQLMRTTQTSYLSNKSSMK